MTQTNALPHYLPSGSSLYRKKPVVIEARQFNGKWTGDGTEILNWMGRGGDWNADTAELKPLRQQSLSIFAIFRLTLPRSWRRCRC
ncbi:hypothetical protein [Pectobacterium odoriferum]|uniref:hypothetical protein n=1 Tax=Pectobacterium odoriferum TaxID=78398 RepID=UPI0015DED432|nr:hypothetical protein [Pectobacterium odoriferum]MBA0188272.1 hypothetical protein [Pectobacterium odoriferum]